MYEQVQLLESLLEKLGALPCIESSNRNIFTSLIEDEEGHRLVMAMNLHSSPQSTDLVVYSTDGVPERRKTMDLSPMEVRTWEWKGENNND